MPDNNCVAARVPAVMARCKTIGDKASAISLKRIQFFCFVPVLSSVTQHGLREQPVRYFGCTYSLRAM